MTKMLELNDCWVNVDHIVSVDHDYEPMECGDWKINIHLSDGRVVHDYEVDYHSMIERYNDIIKEIQS